MVKQRPASQETCHQMLTNPGRGVLEGGFDDTDPECRHDQTLPFAERRARRQWCNKTKLIMFF